MQTDALLTITDVAREMGVERHLAGMYVRQMPCITIGRIKRVKRSDFDRWLLENTRIGGKKKATPKPRKAEAYDPALFEPDGRIKRRRTINRED